MPMHFAEEAGGAAADQQRGPAGSEVEAVEGRALEHSRRGLTGGAQSVQDMFSGG